MAAEPVLHRAFIAPPESLGRYTLKRASLRGESASSRWSAATLRFGLGRGFRRFCYGGPETGHCSRAWRLERHATKKTQGVLVLGRQTRSSAPASGLLCREAHGDVGRRVDREHRRRWRHALNCRWVVVCLTRASHQAVNFNACRTPGSPPVTGGRLR
jgi:hypothetical protein